jgi:ribosomal protein S12 methylthiotransferase
VKIFFISLGCPKNVVDFEIILGGISQDFQIVDDPGAADISIINTCSFIQSAKEEAIDAILEMAQFKKLNPSLKILVTGCLPQRYRRQLAAELPEVDGFFYNTDALETTRQIRRFLGYHENFRYSRKSLTPGHIAYLKISEGCSNRCSYCAIPLIKGPFTSRSIAEILHEAQEMAEKGVKEIVVIAQDSTFYGQDLPNGPRIADVLQKLNDIPQLQWIRLLYTHPAHLEGSLIHALADLDKVVKYVDMPIQHISHRILQQMNRRVNRRHIEALINEIRRIIPDVALRTSLIVGFPGETQQEFEELFDFVKAVKFERLGVFTYSREEDTQAFSFKDNIPQKVKEQRQRLIMELQAEISLQRNESLVGQELLVLVDELNENDNTAIGRTQWDAPEIDNNVILPATVTVGQFYKTRIRSADVYDLYGSEGVGIDH